MGAILGLLRWAESQLVGKVYSDLRIVTSNTEGSTTRYTFIYTTVF